MQISRSNSDPSREIADEEGAPDAAVSADAVKTSKGPTAEQIHAAWQTAFTLSPNVRFTRTPESAIARPQRAVAAPTVETPLPPQVAAAIPTPARPAPMAAAPAQRMAPTQPAAVTRPAVQPAQPLTSPTAQRSGSPYHVKATEIIQTSIVAQQQPGVPSSARLEAARPMPTVATQRPVSQAAVPSVSSSVPISTSTERRSLPISDHAFWELMPEDTDFGSIGSRLPQTPRAPMKAAAPVKGSVTGLYREVQLGGQKAQLPTVAAQIVEVPPVAAAVAHVVEAVLRPPVPEPTFVEVAPQPVEQAPLATAATVVEIPPAPTRTSPIRMADDYDFPPVNLLRKPEEQRAEAMSPEALVRSAGLLESILEDFGVRGEIIDVRPGPVVTLYEFEPAPGVKSSRVIGLSDDIARSMSALSARVAVVPGRNVIGIELPNGVRETVYFRELVECEDYWETKFRLAVCLGKSIGGEPIIADLARMPHLLVAGTTGSGKSVAINTMILSLLYRLKPEECRLIMVDPKMLELSVYDGIPHLLTPVVTDPKKAVMALKWAVREMEDRYRKMSRLGVRNIDGYNTRAASARASGEVVLVNVPTGFDRTTGETTFEDQEMDLAQMPYIVIIVDEMADLMMVAGKEIEGTIQRLAQMARAAGIHLIMATQRPSVDVITGTIKANFPTRISFQVTSKIDSRTILGEQGAEHLLGQGDMLHMVGGGRIARVHGPFVSDAEVEQVVAHLKTQGRPHYLGTIVEDDGDEGAAPAAQDANLDRGVDGADDSDDLYEKAIKVVMRDRKCSTSYIQRRLSIGYNRAASLVERMEQEGFVGPANHVGKREIITGGKEAAIDIIGMGDDTD